MPSRIGLIIPSSNRMVEEEMVRHLPPAVVAHVGRLRMTGAHHVPIVPADPARRGGGGDARRRPLRGHRGA